MFKKILLLNFLIFTIKNLECSVTSSEKEEASNSSSFVPHEYFRVDAEKIDDKPSKPDILKNQNQVVGMMRNLLKKEIRKIKSSMTDSIMEEVINYYGKKLDLTDILKQDIDDLNKKLNALNESTNSLSNNYKSIVKSHRILVDNFRNLINARKEKELAAATAIASTLRTPLKSNIITKTINNTRALNENMKKKSIEHNILIKSHTTSSSRLNQVTKIQDTNQNNIKIADNNKSGFINEASQNPATVFKLVHNENELNEKIYDKKKTHIESQNTLKSSDPNDCQDLRNSGVRINGVYKVLIAKFNQSIEVYCEFENAFGFTVIQSRFDGSVNFYENWHNYKNGFGNMNNHGEFWLGLEKIYLLTGQNNYSLQIKMTDWKDDDYVAEYGSFKLGDEQSKYKLEINDFFVNSTSGDSLGSNENTEISHNNMPFSTFDSDNDMRFYDNCAQIFRSGWWFNACFQSNLNGLFSEENSHMKFLRNGIIWSTIDVNKSLKTTKIRIRRKQM